MQQRVSFFCGEHSSGGVAPSENVMILRSSYLAAVKLFAEGFQIKIMSLRSYILRRLPLSEVVVVIGSPILPDLCVLINIVTSHVDAGEELDKRRRLLPRIMPKSRIVATANFPEAILLNELMVLPGCIPNKGACLARNHSDQISRGSIIGIFSIPKLGPGSVRFRYPIPPDAGCHHFIAVTGISEIEATSFLGRANRVPVHKSPLPVSARGAPEKVSLQSSDLLEDPLGSS